MGEARVGLGGILLGLPCRWINHPGRVADAELKPVQLQVAHDLIGGWPSSSSSSPALMVLMLEALDVHDGRQVLEVGTGTGYNSAILCHRLGDANVTSIDVDSTLVDQARQRLAELGYRPRMAALDAMTVVPRPARCRYAGSARRPQ